jgi:hypothetical protein
VSEAAAITALLDKAAIHDTLLRYCRGADRCDEDLIRSAFHPDALDDHGRFAGTAEDFASWVVGVLRETSVATQHTLPNVLIELQGDAAAVETSFVAYHSKLDERGERIDVFGGRYVDRFEKRAGDWRIAQRTVVHDWSVILRGEPFPFRDTYTQGRRDGTDLVFSRTAAP